VSGVVVRSADSGVGSTEPPESGGAGFAGAEAGTGEVITDRPGRRVMLLLDTPELAFSEMVHGPGQRGTEPHVHHEHTDAFLVVEGTLTVGAGDGTIEAESGSFVVVPPNVVHYFRNTSDETVRFFNFHTPSCGFGDYLRGRNPSFDQHDPPADGGGDPASVVAIRLSGTSF
jgi:mannose-6-phosphate isomerase-like protein (cupin superfamily)